MRKQQVYVNVLEGDFDFPMRPERDALQLDVECALPPARPRAARPRQERARPAQGALEEAAPNVEEHQEVPLALSDKSAESLTSRRPCLISL